MRNLSSPKILLIFLIFFVLFLFAHSQIFANTFHSPDNVASVNGTKLYYEMAGKGKTVVLIHGGLVDSRLWDDQFTEFAKHNRVVRYDLRGFGKSDFPTDAFSYVDDLYELLKFLKVEKATVIGLSLGGMIAADFAIEHPEMVDKLILTSSALRGDTSPPNEQTIAVYEAARDQGMEKAIDLWMENPLFASGQGDPAFVRKTRQMLADNFKNWGPKPQPIRVRWAKQPTIERLAEIKAPTLIIVGDKDDPVILSIGEILNSKISSSQKKVIANAGHHLNMQRPREYNRTVLDFLKRG